MAFGSRRKTQVLCSKVFCLLAFCLLTHGADPPLDFNRDVRPILTGNCFTCHGPDEKERKAELRLDNREGAIAAHNGVRAIVPGYPLESELIRRITTADPTSRMPPFKKGKKLAPEEIETLRRWISEGAPYAEHWAHVSPVRPPIPQLKNAAWPRNPIDSFIFEQLEKLGISPSPEADRHAIVRRVSLDLTGLPPTPEEVERFVTDSSPDAYERLVSRLLASQSYGEHWARMWLDLARYADSAGYADDPSREIWAYRDWVIRAFNSNLPFDQFTLEQLAGDLFPNPTRDQLIATAFHRNTQTNNEGGTDDEEFRNVAIVDRVNTTLAVWMGTTMACAQCHNHKYDPLSQEEYFRMFAILNNTEDTDRGDENPRLPFYTDEQERRKATLHGQIAALEAKLKTPTPELLAAQVAWERSFPRDLVWTSPSPVRVASEAGAGLEVLEDDSTRVPPGEEEHSVTIEVPLAVPKLQALRIDALPQDALPETGPEAARAGRFEAPQVRAVLTPPRTVLPAGRFVRLELPGKGRYLHIAEVQVVSGGQNVALRGEARQINTDYNGPAEHAVDGKTDGAYASGSTTHTRLCDDPWWEVDLKSTLPIEKVVVWNRTDNGLQSRLDGFRIQLLGEKRETIWQSDPQEGPQTSAALEPGDGRVVAFKSLIVSGKPSIVTLITAQPVDVATGSLLTVTIKSGSTKGSRRPGCFTIRLADPASATEWARTPAAIVEALLEPQGGRTEARRAEITRHFLETVATELEPVRTALASAGKELAEVKPYSVPILRELAQVHRRKTQIQYRGNFLDKGPEVVPGVPSVFSPIAKDTPFDRMALARWLMDARNPLTARVTVNRYWEQVFGTGLVATSEEFGAQGEPCSHPKLLDWLAVELVEGHWDLKRLLWLLVTSASYRQSSRVTPELLERDPDNRLLSRGPRFRLAAETIRDQALFSSGLLSHKMYGPPVHPPQPSSGLNAAFGSAVDWQTSGGEDKYRRGIYIAWRRSNPYPSMSTFDATSREVCTIRRSRSNTPLQALVTLNDPVFVEAAQALARRMAAEAGAAPADRARFGFRLCLARPPLESELARLVSLYAEARERFARDLAQAKLLTTEPLGPLPDGADTADLAAWTLVANVLLNLDEIFLCP